MNKEKNKERRNNVIFSITFEKRRYFIMNTYLYTQLLQIINF